jgi:hypothetical protein
VLDEVGLPEEATVIEDVNVSYQQSSKLGLMFSGEAVLDIFPSDVVARKFLPQRLAEKYSYPPLFTEVETVEIMVVYDLVFL